MKENLFLLKKIGYYGINSGYPTSLVNEFSTILKYI